MIKKESTMSCVACGKSTTTLHEVFHGTHGRQISIKYNLQVPVCTTHHNVAHGIKPPGLRTAYEEKSQEECVDFFCKFLDIDKWKVMRDIKGDRRKREYLESIKERCLIKIRSTYIHERWQ